MRKFIILAAALAAMGTATVAWTDISKGKLSTEEAEEWGRIALSCFWPDGRFKRATDWSERALQDGETRPILMRYLTSFKDRDSGGDRYLVIKAEWNGGILGTPYQTDFILHIKEGLLQDEYKIGVLFSIIPPSTRCPLSQSFGEKP